MPAMRLLAAALLAVLAAACSRTPTAPVAGELPTVVVSKRVTPIRAALPRPGSMIPATTGGRRSQ
ncbi:MAG: hypothetical protein JWM27_1560 [Gemmatimonadetes bacterium]|nr:hypothetical protein [Gemmatimonadota bacterium]